MRRAASADFFLWFCGEWFCSEDPAAGPTSRRGKPPAFAGVDRGLLAALRSAPV